MNALSVVILIFSIAAAVDYVIGNKLGIGKEYEKGFEYLELADYEPTEVSDELFSELAKNDDAFSGLILDIHSENKIISKEELLI